MKNFNEDDFKRLRTALKLRIESDAENNEKWHARRYRQVLAKVEKLALTQSFAANNKATLAAPQMLTALENIAARFPIEFGTTTRKCTCLQFEDNNICRHILVLKAIKAAK